LISLDFSPQFDRHECAVAVCVCLG